MAEKRVIELEIKEKGISSLKEQLASAKQSVQDLADRFGASSKQVADAADQVRSLEKEIKQTNKTLKSVSFEGKFNAISGSITGVLNGLQAFQGSLGLIGVEGKNVESALLKVQSVMALTDGIEGVFAAQTSFKKLQTLIGDAASSAVKGFQNMTTAGKAFAVTGIGLLITGLGLVITYWDDISKAIGITSAKEEEAAKKRSEYKKKQIEETKQYRDTISKESSEFVGLIYQLKQTNENTKQRKELIDQINNQYGTTLKNLKDEKSFQDQLNIAVNDYLNFQRAKYNLQKNDKERQRLLAKEDELNSKIATAIFDIGDAQRLANTGNTNAIRILNEKNEKLKVLNSTLKYVQNRQEDIAKQDLQLTEQTKNKYIPVQDAKIKKIKEVTKETENQTEALRDNNQELLDAGDKFAEAAKKRRDKTEQEIKDSEQAKFDVSRFWQNLELNFTLKNEEEKRQARQKTVDFTLESANQMLNIVGDLAQQSENKFKSLNEAVLNNQKLTDKQKQKLLDENNKRAKKAFEVQKAASIASTLINTYMSARSAYFSQFLPIPDASSPIRGGIAAALSVAGGLVAVKNIASQKFEGASLSGGGGGDSGGGVGGGAGASNVITPNFNIVGNAQATNPLAGLGTMPLQAYVVSGEVTSAQSLDRNRINYATFG